MSLLTVMSLMSEGVSMLFLFCLDIFTSDKEKSFSRLGLKIQYLSVFYNLCLELEAGFRHEPGKYSLISPCGPHIRNKILYDLFSANSSVSHMVEIKRLVTYCYPDPRIEIVNMYCYLLH